MSASSHITDFVDCEPCKFFRNLSTCQVEATFIISGMPKIPPFEETADSVMEVCVRSFPLQRPQTWLVFPPPAAKACPDRNIIRDQKCSIVNHWTSIHSKDSRNVKDTPKFSHRCCAFIDPLIQIIFFPEQVSTRLLLAKFFGAHNRCPGQLSRARRYE